MICRFCGNNRELADAHIIPESFFRPLRDEHGPLRIYGANEFPKKSPSGVYDKEIICQKCENEVFNQYDDYGFKILVEKFDSYERILHEGKTKAFLIPRFDFKKLKLFFMSVLWRASVSTHPFYQQVDLGKYELGLKTMIENDDPGQADDFPVVVAYFSDWVGKNVMFSPRKWRATETRCIFYGIYLGAYFFYVKVDQRPYPETYQNYVMRPGQKLYVLVGESFNAPEFDIIKDTLKRKNKGGRGRS